MSSDGGLGSSADRTRTGWWVFILLLVIIATFIAYSFIGMVALGVFGYYAARPIQRRLARVINSDGIAAGATVLVVTIPVIVLVVYAGSEIFQQIQQAFSAGRSGVVGGYFDFSALPPDQRQMVISVIQNPRQFIGDPQQTLQTLFRLGEQILGAIFGTIVLLAITVAFSYFLLKHDSAISTGLRELFGGRDTTAYAYASAVDADLESVFFGNLLFVVAMAAIATASYWVTNMLAPPGLHVPMVVVLGFLTGVASLIPIVVGKVIYLPIVLYLAFQALRSSGGGLLFVAGVLVAYFFLLDILPQTFLQPYITGRRIDMLVMMFAYILGPILFGWYGFFLMPIIFIVMLEAIRIPLPELVRGEPLTPEVSLGKSIGTDPQSLFGEPNETPNTDADETVEDEDAAADGG